MVHKFKLSMGNALRGIAFVWSQERNFRIEVVLGILAIAGSIALGFSYGEFCIVILAVASVLTGEIINTIIEELLDVIAPQYSDHVRHLKDVTAGAVLLLSTFACVAGFATLINHFYL